MNHLDSDMDLTDDDITGAGDSSGHIGRFRVEGIIGRGGMGEVYKAWDPDQNRTIAIKILDTRGYEDADTVKRFEREAQAALVLDHPNIARFYGTERDSRGRPIIVMEYISGRGMDVVLEEEPDMPYSKRVDYMIQTARGLENAYRRSIIHRDIKPGNLLIDRDHNLKIIDFGLAKSMWDNTNLTGSGLVVGTPRYISPEQGMGRNVDHRSDIYSLGATFYEVMTGRTPFEGDTPLAIMMKHISAVLVPPYMINPKVPGDISEIIIKMMAKEPAHRYQDYEPLIRDLESAKIHRLSKERRAIGQISAMQTVVIPEAPPGESEELQPTNYLTEGLVNIELHNEPEHGPSPARLVLLSLAGLVVLFFCAVFLLKPVDSESGKSSLGQRLSELLPQAKEKLAPAASAKEIAEQDAEFIQTTRSRMEAVISHILSSRNGGIMSSEMPTIAALRSSDAFTEDQTRDAWGNDFYITDSTGGGILVAVGRDGADNTSDDFRMSLDGSEQVIPEPLKIEEAKDTAP